MLPVFGSLHQDCGSLLSQLRLVVISEVPRSGVAKVIHLPGQMALPRLNVPRADSFRRSPARVGFRGRAVQHSDRIAGIGKRMGSWTGASRQPVKATSTDSSHGTRKTWPVPGECAPAARCGTSASSTP
jgi:hypothetical protein